MRYLIIILIALMSCSKEVEIEQPAYESKIAVDGWIEDGDFANVILTRSSPFLTDYDSASIRNTFLNYAKVTLIAGNGDSEVLTLFRKDEFFPPFIYKSIRLKGKPGESYQLKIEVSGETITANTSIPDTTIVNSIHMIPASDTTVTIEAIIEDAAGQENYYYTEINTLNVDTRFHPSAQPLATGHAFNGQTTTLSVGRSNQPDPLNIYNIDAKRNLPRLEFAITDTVFVKVSCLDKNAYQVLNAIYLDHLNSDNPFSFIEKKTATNIEGGIGRWTGQASVTWMVFWKKNSDSPQIRSLQNTEKSPSCSFY